MRRDNVTGRVARGPAVAVAYFRLTVQGNEAAVRQDLARYDLKTFELGGE